MHRMVIAKAQALEAVLLSLNGDFAYIVRYPPSQYRGIIALQIKNHPARRRYHLCGA